MIKYRVIHLVVHLGWVDLDFQCSTVIPVLFGPMGIWQDGLSSKARRCKQIKVNLSEVHKQVNHPVHFLIVAEAATAADPPVELALSDWIQALLIAASYKREIKEVVEQGRIV